MIKVVPTVMIGPAEVGVQKSICDAVKDGRARAALPVLCLLAEDAPGILREPVAHDLCPIQHDLMPPHLCQDTSKTS